MKIRPGLSAFFVLLSFSAIQYAGAQSKQGVIVVVKRDNKYPLPMQDTLIKCWLRGDLFKLWPLHKTGLGMAKGDSDGVTEQSFVPDETNKDTSKFKDKSHHIE